MDTVKQGLVIREGNTIYITDFIFNYYGFFTAAKLTKLAYQILDNMGYSYDTDTRLIIKDCLFQAGDKYTGMFFKINRFFFKFCGYGE